jgi:hypothetical protein
MAPKIQAGITVNAEIWNEFKEKYSGGKASERVEQLMRWDLENTTSEFPDILSSENVRSLSFNLDQWNAQVRSGHLQLNNVMYTSSSTGSFSDDAIVQIYNTTVKDIKVE